MNTSKHLFIGGVADGHVRSVLNGDPYHRVAVVEEAEIDFDKPVTEVSAQTRQSDYRRERLVLMEDEWGRRNTIEFFVHAPLTTEQAFMLLLQNYRPQQQ